MASSSHSSKPPPSCLHIRTSTRIKEGNEDEEEKSSSVYKHNRGIGSSRKWPVIEGITGDDDNRDASCNEWRSRDSNNRKYSASPNGIFKAVFSLVKKSPRSFGDRSPAPAAGEEKWEIATVELSRNLEQATRKRDEAILEASRLKSAMADMEKKLSEIEIYCDDLKSGLEIVSINSPPANQERVIENFLVALSEARSAIRLVSRSLTLNLKEITNGGKVYNRISSLLQPYDIKISSSRNPRSLLLYLEALLNRAFFEDFETIGFEKSSSYQILNPIDRCITNFATFNRLQRFKWKDVLNKGTRLFCNDFSSFCDRKMTEIVTMLGWDWAWPEPLVLVFFEASKAVWSVHLLANSVHPGLPIFRVDKDMRFDPIYMEDMGPDNIMKLVPTLVRIMVTPGFYVYDNVAKCKVVCKYSNNNNGPK